MVKECSVVLNNDAVTVVRFNDIDIQFPSIKKDEQTVFVNCVNDKYSIVDEQHYKAENVNKPKKKIDINKKTTIDKND